MIGTCQQDAEIEQQSKYFSGDLQPVEQGEKRSEKRGMRRISQPGKTLLRVIRPIKRVLSILSA